jgi:hypothetical protein
MSKDIEQLIKRIQKASVNLRPPRDIWSLETTTSEGDIEDMCYIESITPEYNEPISDITGINAYDLPLPDKLSKEEKGKLAEVLLALLEVFNFKLIFPSKLPNHLKYTTIFSFWFKKSVAVSFGVNEIDTCNGDESNCPFPNHCILCKEYRDEEDTYNSADNFANSEDFDIRKLLPSPEEVEKFMQRNYPESGNESVKWTFSADEHLAPAIPEKCKICENYILDTMVIYCDAKRFEEKDSKNFTCGKFKESDLPF